MTDKKGCITVNADHGIIALQPFSKILKCALIIDKYFCHLVVLTSLFWVVSHFSFAVSLINFHVQNFFLLYLIHYLANFYKLKK